jgi:hypothetical protein
VGVYQFDKVMSLICPTRIADSTRYSASIACTSGPSLRLLGESAFRAFGQPIRAHDRIAAFQKAESNTLEQRRGLILRLRLKSEVNRAYSPEAPRIGIMGSAGW